MRTRIHKAAAVATIAALFSTNAFAQGDANGLVGGGVQDANTLLGAYASPVLKAFGSGLNAGWFNTAKPHGIGGFDITVCANAAFAPTEDQSFSLNNLHLNLVRPIDASQPTTSPTIFGSDKDKTPEMGLYKRVPGADQDSLITRFTLPQGMGVNFLPVPTAQLAVGVGYGTEVAVRFTPEQKFDKTSVGMYGFAVKHDFKQWIPAMKDMPFDLSALFGFTHMGATIGLDDMTAISSTSSTYSPNAGKVYRNEQMEFKSNAWALNVIISKKLLFFTPYLGVGYQYARTTLDLTGTYPVTDVNESFDPTKAYGTPGYNANDPNSHPKVVKELQDPINLSGTISNVKATLGFRLKLAILTIHADYTFAKYDIATIGVGLNLQSIKPFAL